MFTILIQFNVFENIHSKTHILNELCMLKTISSFVTQFFVCEFEN